MKDTLTTISIKVIQIINDNRKSNRLSNLYRDKIAEVAIENYMMNGKQNELYLDNQLKEQHFFSKYYKKTEWGFNMTQGNDPKAYIEDCIQSVKEKLRESNSIFLSNNECFTHISVKSELDEHALIGRICLILSQKLVGVEGCFYVKEGIVIVGSILTPQMTLYGVCLTKGNDKINVGPTFISTNDQLSSFVIVLDSKKYPNLKLGLRKVLFYLKSQGVPNPEFDEFNINWLQFELGLNEMLDFKKEPSILLNKYKTQEVINMNATGELHEMLHLNQNTSSTQIKDNLINSSKANQSIGNNNLFNKPSGSLNSINSLNTYRAQNKLLNNNNNLSTIQELKSEHNNSISNEDQLRNHISNQLSQAEQNKGYSSINNNLTTNFQQQLPQQNNFQHNVNNNQSNSNHQANSIRKILDPHYNGHQNQLNNQFAPHMSTPGMNKNINYQQGQQGNLNNNYASIQKNLFNNPTNNQNNQNNQYQPHMVNNHQLNIAHPQNQIIEVNPYVNNHNNNNNFDFSLLKTSTPDNKKTISLINQPYISNIPNNLFHNQNINYQNVFDLNKNTHQTNYVNYSYQQLPIKATFQSNPSFLNNLSTTQFGNCNNMNAFNIQAKAQYGAIKAPDYNEFLAYLNIYPHNHNNNVFTNNNSKIAHEHKANLEDELIGYNKRTFKFFQNTHNSKDQKQDKNSYLSPKKNLKQKYAKNYIQHTDEKALKEAGILTNSTIKFLKANNHNPDNFQKHNIDKYIFNDYYKESKDIDKADYEKEKVENEKKKINEKILDFLSSKYLRKEETESYNTSYEELYFNKSCYDVSLCIESVEIQAHKVILITKSSYFKELINNHELQNKGFSYCNYTSGQTGITKIVLNDKINPTVLELIIQYLYLNEISVNLIKQNQSIYRKTVFNKEKLGIDNIVGINELKVFREMLLLADFFMISSLQKILIVKYIIPNITKEIAIKFLKDGYNRQTTPETSDVWGLLVNFSLNCVAKNSNILIKNNRNELLGMNTDLLFKVVEQSAFYLIEENHLSSLIKLIIDVGYATDIFDLLIKLSKNCLNARNFDSQDIDLRHIRRMIDPTEPMELVLLDESKTNYIKKKEEKDKLNPEISKDKVEVIKQITNSPSSNHTSIDIIKGKDPSFSFAFSIDYEKTAPCSIFSQCFNTNSRSWFLKIDIRQDGSVSLYLVEKGDVLVIDKKLEFNNAYHDKYSIQYTSTLFDFEVKDVSFSKNGVIFYSFANDQNIPIGYENFFNLKQLGNKESCLINIWIKEFPLHSACLQHISDNFSGLSLYDKKINGNNDNIKINNKCIYDILPSDLAYIISSDHMNVHSEDELFSFLYKYCSIKLSSDIDVIINNLRFKYISFSLLCSAARDHVVIKQSEAFKKHFSDAIEKRLNNFYNDNHLDINDESKNNITGHFAMAQSNQYINQSSNLSNISLCSRTDKPRLKYSNDINKTISSLSISSELVNFFLNNEHHGSFKSEISRLQKIIETEKEELLRKERIFNQQRKQMQLEIDELRDKDEKRKRFISQLQSQNSVKEQTKKDNEPKCIVF